MMYSRTRPKNAWPFRPRARALLICTRRGAEYVDACHKAERLTSLMVLVGVMALRIGLVSFVLEVRQSPPQKISGKSSLPAVIIRVCNRVVVYQRKKAGGVCLDLLA